MNPDRSNPSCLPISGNYHFKRAIARGCLIGLLTLCSGTALPAQTPFLRGTQVLEGGLDLYVEGKLGARDVDVTKVNFSRQNGLQVGGLWGRMWRDNAEMFLMVSYQRYSRFSTSSYFSPLLTGPVTTERNLENQTVGWGVGIRRYYPVGSMQRFFAGYNLLAGGQYNWEESSDIQISPQPAPFVLPVKNHSWGIQMTGQPFLAYLLRPRLGLRVSVGSIGLQVRKHSDENYYRTLFNLSLRSTFYPDFSIFWLFYASRADRD